MIDLSGRAALVTGASRGIGRAIAARLVAAGADVCLAARDRVRLEVAAAELAAGGPGRARAIVADVREAEACARMVEEAVAAFSRLDVLVNNAGIGVFEPVETMSLDDWRAQIATNLDSAFFCCRAAIPHLRASEGWIINVASLAARNPFAGGAAYNASKFGLLGFSEALMLEVRHDGIRVSCVMPGSVATEFSHPQGPGGEEWRLHGDDVAQVVLDLLAYPSRALPSRIEIRPTRPPRKPAP